MNIVHLKNEVFKLSKIIENPKQLILNKSKEILYNEGYMKLNMRNVAKKCDIALGTIYNYYPTKKALVIDMMTIYWKEFLSLAKDTADSDEPFYDKLKALYCKLSDFIKTFKQLWLAPELYNTPDYIQSGLEKEVQFMEKLIRIVEKILIREGFKNNKFSSYEMAKFIVMNFITVIQMPAFEYSSFEKILKELIK